MENGQKLTQPESPPLVMDENGQVKVLKINQQKWIDYNAVGGLITDNDGALTTMTIVDFAAAIGVSKQTLYNWRNDIPDFWERVGARRKELGSQARLAKVYNGLYLRAAKGEPKAVALYLGVFDNWQPPAQKHEVQVTHGLADLVAKKKLELDRKVIDATANDGSTTSPSNG